MRVGAGHELGMQANVDGDKIPKLQCRYWRTVEKRASDGRASFPAAVWGVKGLGVYPGSQAVVHLVP